jgi:riboflavin kinase / FMN adenylyltransferase
LNIYTDISEVKLSRPVATIGIFDGVHLAHSAIINRLLEKAKEIDGQSLIVTLWPHPRIVLQKEGQKISLISTLDEKIDLLQERGIENVLILDFNKSISETDFEDFVKNYLVDALNIQHLVVGYNHHFGKNREGNFEKLQPLSEKFGFGLEQLPPVIINDEKISSSVIRKLIDAGDIKSATSCLGHFFSITGVVANGSKIGREIGFPTANIELNDPYKLIPPTGVYSVIVELGDGIAKMGMMNIGYRPTVNVQNKVRTLEVNIIDFEANLYNKTLKILFVEKIRNEKKFNNLDELKTQLEKDRITSRQILSKLKINYL